MSRGGFVRFLSYLLILSAAACGGREPPRVLVAELIEEKNPDGAAAAGETIRLTLDRPLPEGFLLEDVRVRIRPPLARLLVRVQPLSGSRPTVLDLELLSTPENLKAAGIFTDRPDGAPGRPSETRPPSGIGVDLGPVAPGEQWVDLQEVRHNPELIRAVWEDRTRPGERGGNLAVDPGDAIRLRFDRPVQIAGEPGAVRAPADFLLPHHEDQIDDGAELSRIEPGSDPFEVRLVLGSNPRLVIAGRHRRGNGPSGSAGADFRSSAIAVNGTPVKPMEKIADRRGNSGAISRGPIDIEFPPDYFFFEKQVDVDFPAPGHRTQFTVSPLSGGRAVVAGGTTADGKAIAQVLLFDPQSPRIWTIIGEMPEPRSLHTATLLPGEDGQMGTLDDLVAIAGGWDGQRALGSLIVIAADPESPDRLFIETIPTALQVPRIYHSAVFVPPDRLLIEGGYAMPSGGGASGIISTCESIAVEFRGRKASARPLRQFPARPRMHHASAYLGRDSEGVPCVFTHGGVGAPEAAARPPGFFPIDESVVLGAPVVTRILPGGEEQASIDFEWSYEMLRYSHGAVAAGFDPLGSTGNAGREVLLAAGVLHPLHFDPNRPWRFLYEAPRRPEEADRVNRKPLMTENASALLFEFLPADWKRSSLRVLPSPSGERRVHATVVALDRPGILILGGENPQDPREVHISGEIYLYGEKRLAPLAIPLAAPRTRAGAATVSLGQGEAVYLFGGTLPTATAEGFSDVEKLRLEWK